MDNITHSLAGLVIAESVWQRRQSRGHATPAAGFRTVAALAGVAAANLPDIDVLDGVARRLDPLASLLQHRGYTHTWLAGAIGAVLIWGIALVLWRWRERGSPARAGTADTAVDRRWLLGLVAVAMLSHLALDWTNDYGVHPFSPLGNAWHYGDAVFIVEPWLWVAAVPPLLLAARRRALRVTLGVVLAAAVALAWSISLVPWGAALALTLGVAAALVIATRLTPRARAAFAVGGWLAVELVFVAGTRAARAQVVAAAASGRDAGARLVDVVITPAPADPLCARALAIETLGPDDRATYRVTTAWVAALPAVLPAARCALPPTALGEPSLATSAPTRASTDGVQWRRRWQAPLADLVALGRDNCWALAVLRFARVPAWTAVGADSVLVEDLRYDRGDGPGFAGFTVPRRPTACPEDVPPWRPPRADVLGDR